MFGSGLVRGNGLSQNGSAEAITGLVKYFFLIFLKFQSGQVTYTYM